MSAEENESRPLGGVLDELERATEGDGDVCVGDLVESFGRRGYGALLFVPAMLEMSPIGGIPGVPTVLALVIVLFAVQILVGRSHMWLPSLITRRELPSEKLSRTVGKARPWAKRLDGWFHGRLGALTGSNAARVAAAVCVLLACTVPPLEVVPFASTAPMAAVALFGVALLVHDGLVMLAGYALAAVAIGVVVATLL